MSGVGSIPNPAGDVPPDEQPGISERLPPDDSDPVHPRSEATGGWHEERPDEADEKEMGERR